MEKRLTAPYYIYFLEHDLPVYWKSVPFETRWRMWQQQDGAPPHSGRISEYFNENWEER